MEKILRIIEDRLTEYENRLEYLRRENARLVEENAELREKIALHEIPKKVANV
jgi:regulator of replication initiation timing